MKEIQNNTSQSNSDSEVEDLMNPKDPLKKKIVNLACTIRKWNEETVQVRKSVREQLQEILNLGLNTYKMEKDELRRLTEVIFRYHGINESWLRKLLPEGLKDTSKTRISYLHKQEIVKERQRLLQQISESQQSSNPGASSSLSLESSLEFESGDHTPANYIVMKPESPDKNTSMKEYEMVANRSNETNKRIQDLEAEVRRLSEPFVAKTYLPAISVDIPLVVEIDPVKKVIISIHYDNEATSI